MPASNTKLSSYQKEWLKDWIKNNPTSEFIQKGDVTILVRQEFNGSRMYRVAVSTMSPDEKKFRPSVGKFWALQSLMYGTYVLMNGYTLVSFLESIDAHL